MHRPNKQKDSASEGKILLSNYKMNIENPEPSAFWEDVFPRIHLKFLPTIFCNLQQEI